jgi:hypothetical protein
MKYRVLLECGVRLHHKMDLQDSRKSASLSKANDVSLSKIADSNYCSVNAYYVDVLNVVFSQPV